MENNIDKKRNTKKTTESRLTGGEILDLIAKISHETWMRQAFRDKKIPLGDLPREVSDSDKERAEDAWRALENDKPETREKAIDLLAKRSHEMWLAFKTKQSSIEGLDPNPNNHDRERAEDIIRALEESGVLSFEK